jgi:hypothetical protein
MLDIIYHFALWVNECIVRYCNACWSSSLTINKFGIFTSNLSFWSKFGNYAEYCGCICIFKFEYIIIYFKFCVGILYYISSNFFIILFVHSLKLSHHLKLQLKFNHFSQFPKKTFWHSLKTHLKHTSHSIDNIYPYKMHIYRITDIVITNE